MNNEKLQVKIINCENGEEIVRDATEAEIAQRQLDAEEESFINAQKEAKAQAKAALLNKLGITEDEARLLLGGN